MKLFKYEKTLNTRQVDLNVKVYGSWKISWEYIMKLNAMDVKKRETKFMKKNVLINNDE